MQGVLERYLKKHSLYQRSLQESFSADTGIAVCIPCNDEPNITSTLDSLTSCCRPQAAVAVILLINQIKDCDESIDLINQKCYDDIVNWREAKDTFLQIMPVRMAFENTKQAGVGLARKVAMDEAIRQFLSIKKDGIIICLDADCQVDENYFIEIEKYFMTNPKIGATSISFQHSLIDLPEPLYTSILNYELHLRYYRHAQKYSGYPHAFYTIGSCMAVRATSYAAYGGMNKRQAGEDFYFLSKFMEAGKMGEIIATRVFPSPRMSDRVPFGTGRIVEGVEGQKFKTYSFEIFKIIKSFLDAISLNGWANEYEELLPLLPKEIMAFLDDHRFKESLDNIKSNTTSREAFMKRFYRWLNPLKYLKLVHHLRDVKYGKREVGEQAFELLTNLDIEYLKSKPELLDIFRNLDNQSILANKKIPTN